ncbi:general secretion pathway protein H [Pseudomonas sp. NFACC09-4]|uniref:GspH/FimT family pseudopilin n=1 Tax=Pseudomonas TaxID=286 RepID=UPI000908D2A9|nr:MULTISPECIES: GspH/FimT family pseudopilin [Pseudomonas]NHN68211.1 prepilin-type N-terminal cleavage/methylation domain-containing protein [Pseudomonas fluorescens]SFW83925.1 general secretion pathway protein H [Pseudomonas sp. NFACC09-4]
MRQSGFTLLEMLAVLVLISIALLLLASGITRGLAHARERQSVNELLVSLRQARTQAIVQGRPMSLIFDLQSTCYRVEQFAPRCLSAGTQLRVETAEGLGKDATMIFYPDGSSSGGNLSLKNAFREARIDVAWLTGNVSLVEHAQ